IGKIVMRVSVDQAGNDRDVAQIQVGGSLALFFDGKDQIVPDREGSPVEGWTIHWKNPSSGKGPRFVRRWIGKIAGHTVIVAGARETAKRTMIQSSRHTPCAVFPHTECA